MNNSISLSKNWDMAIEWPCHSSFSLWTIKEYNYTGCTALSCNILTPNQTPTPTRTTSTTTATALHHDADTPVEGSLDGDEEPMEWYHIAVSPPLPGTLSQQVLQAKNMMLWDIISQAGIVLEKSYVQMKLMDLENKRLRKQVFEKGKRKNQNKLTFGHTQHMTAVENLDLLAWQNWKGGMKDVLKEAAPDLGFWRRISSIIKRRLKRWRRWLSMRWERLLQLQHGLVVMVQVIEVVREGGAQEGKEERHAWGRCSWCWWFGLGLTANWDDGFIREQLWPQLWEWNRNSHPQIMPTAPYSVDSREVMRWLRMISLPET